LRLMQNLYSAHFSEQSSRRYPYLYMDLTRFRMAGAENGQKKSAKPENAYHCRRNMCRGGLCMREYLLDIPYASTPLPV
jgi:hypothetical protein